MGGLAASARAMMGRHNARKPTAKGRKREKGRPSPLPREQCPHAAATLCEGQGTPYRGTLENEQTSAGKRAPGALSSPLSNDTDYQAAIFRQRSAQALHLVTHSSIPPIRSQSVAHSAQISAHSRHVCL